MSQAGGELPDGAVLVHIGPYKTGTTAIQFSLHKHRADLLARGVLYPGDDDHRQTRPGYALLGKTPSGLPPTAAHEWDDLVEEVRSTRMRVCISSEDLASAGPRAIRTLVDDLGPDRVHVLIVVRRLDKILPSAWQERIKSWNETLAYEDWLREVLAEDPSRTSAGRRFWHNHGVAQLLGRWTSVLPAQRCILSVADEQDRGSLLRTFEGLLGLPSSLLTPGRHDNTSLTMDRVELVRRVNELREERGWDDEHRRKLVYRGLVKGLRQAPPEPDDVPIPPLPRWAAERVAILSAERAAAVQDSGGKVIGDPANLLPPDGAGHPEAVMVPQSVPIETAARAVEAVLDAALRMEKRAVRGHSRQKSEDAVSPATQTAEVGTTSRGALRALSRRVWNRSARLRRGPSAR